MKSPVFLSASVPTREPFVSDFDPVAIREAILALVVLVVRDRELVFGGHPAISPLVEHAARSLDATGHVHIYQSRRFEDVLPDAARRFENLHWTDAITGTEDDLAKSLTKMRQEMISSWKFSSAVVIGGMEGIFEEVELFEKYHSGRPIIPLASTGGAAKAVLSRAKGWADDTTLEALAHEGRYRRLLQRLVPDD
jgi:hypothetical protein